jgi:hypothetical protein
MENVLSVVLLTVICRGGATQWLGGAWPKGSPKKKKKKSKKKKKKYNFYLYSLKNL